MVLIENLPAEFDALLTDVDARAGDELPHLVLAFTAERTPGAAAAPLSLHAMLLSIHARA